MVIGKDKNSAEEPPCSPKGGCFPFALKGDESRHNTTLQKKKQVLQHTTIPGKLSSSCPSAGVGDGHLCNYSPKSSGATTESYQAALQKAGGCLGTFPSYSWVELAVGSSLVLLPREMTSLTLLDAILQNRKTH